MRKTIFLTTAVLSVALSACRQDKTNALHKWEDYQEMTGTPLGGDSLFLGHPGSVAYFDGQLGIYDFYDGNIFTWIDLQRGTSRHNTRFGEGPGEFLPPLYLYKDKNPENIKIFERSKGVCYTYRLTDALNGTLAFPLRRDSVGMPGNQVVPCGDRYAGNQMLDDGKMFYLWAPEQGVKIRFGVYSGSLKGTDDASVLDMMTQCQMAANPEGSVVVGRTCCRFIG